MKKKRQEILKQKEILIAGTATKVVKYLEVSPTTQCTSCQKFSHIGDRCSTRACRFCAAAHLSKDHSCSTCTIIGRCNRLPVLPKHHLVSPVYHLVSLVYHLVSIAYHPVLTTYQSPLSLIAYIS